MSSNPWPHWPEDQLSLFDLPDPVVEDKTDRVTRTKGEVVAVTVECLVCGHTKTKGLPCPWCQQEES